MVLVVTGLLTLAVLGLSFVGIYVVKPKSVSIRVVLVKLFEVTIDFVSK